MLLAEGAWEVATVGDREGRAETVAVHDAAQEARLVGDGAQLDLPELGQGQSCLPLLLLLQKKTQEGGPAPTHPPRGGS